MKKSFLCYSYFIAAPNVFRIDVEETIYVRFSYKTSIELLVQDPRSSKVISRVNVNLDPGMIGFQLLIVD